MNRVTYMITGNHQLKARKVHFDFTESSVCWMPNDPLCSHVANGINMLLPAGEFWFCRVFNKTLPLITDEALKQEVIGFVRQEAAHARAHEKHRTSYVKMVTTFRNTQPCPFCF